MEYGNIDEEKPHEDSKGREHKASPIIPPPHASTQNMHHPREYQKERDHNKTNPSDLSSHRSHHLFISLSSCPNLFIKLLLSFYEFLNDLKAALSSRKRHSNFWQE
jgi:hypothetical protein